jgi:hypothetical protein
MNHGSTVFDPELDSTAFEGLRPERLIEVRPKGARRSLISQTAQIQKNGERPAVLAPWVPPRLDHPPEPNAVGKCSLYCDAIILRDCPFLVCVLVLSHLDEILIVSLAISLAKSIISRSLLARLIFNVLAVASGVASPNAGMATKRLVPLRN